MSMHNVDVFTYNMLLMQSEIQGIPYNEQRELEKAMRLSLMKMKPKPKPKLKDQKSHSTPKLNVTNPQPPVCLPVPPKIHKVTEPVHKPSPSFIQDDIKPPIAAAKSEGYKKSSRACFKPSSYNTNDSVLIDVLSDDSNYMTSSSSDSDSYEKSKSPKKKKKNKKGNKRITSTTSGSIPETKKSLKKKTHGYSDVEQVQHITFSERYSSDTQSSNDVQILTGITSLQESACQSKSSNKRKNKVILLDISPTVSSSLSTASLPSSEASSCSMDMIIPIDLTKDDIKSPSKKKTFVATTKLKSKKLNKEFTKGNISFEKKKIYKKKNLISSLSKQSTLMQKEFQLTPHVHTDNTSILGGVSGPISTIPTISTSHTDELMSSSINLSGGKLQDISDVNTPFRPCNEGTVSEDMERSPLSRSVVLQFLGMILYKL